MKRYSMYIIVIILYLFATIQVQASPITPNIEWSQSLGGSSLDWFGEVIQTDDGGYIAGGSSYSSDGDMSGNHGNVDYAIVKLNGEGIPVWSKSFGGSSAEYFSDIKQTSDGGYIVAGNALSGDGDVPYHGNRFMGWILKLDSSGEITWSKLVGCEYPNSIQQTSDGGYIIAGASTMGIGNNGSYDYWISKVDSSGEKEWEMSLGGSGSDSASCIEQTVDGGYIVAGSTDSMDGDVLGSYGEGDYWIIKIDYWGGVEWSKCFGGSRNDVAYKIQQTMDGGYVAIGYSDSPDGDVNNSAGTTNAFIVKLDRNGESEWNRCVGGYINNQPYDIQQTSEGGYIIASNCDSAPGNHGNADYWIVKLNSRGNVIWDMSLGGSLQDTANSISQTEDGGYIIAGSSTSIDGDVIGANGMSDGWIVKLMNSETAMVTGIILNPSETVVEEGVEFAVTATIIPSNAANKTVQWNSSDEGIATVDGSGTVTAIGEGVATITATTEDGGYSGTCHVTVKPRIIPVSGVTLNQTEMIVEVGNGFVLTAIFDPSNATNKTVQWESSDVSIAVVDGSGTVTAIGEGVATITATTEDGGYSETCHVTVKPRIIPVSGVTLNQTEMTVEVGNGFVLTAIFDPSNATNKTVQWESSDVSIAVVDDSGTVTTIGVGTTTITVMTEDGAYSGICQVIVTPRIIPVSGVTLNQIEKTAEVGNEFVLTVNVDPLDATNKNVFWTSSDENIATVDTNGKVLTISEGVVTITVTAEDGGIEAHCQIVILTKIDYIIYFFDKSLLFGTLESNGDSRSIPMFRSLLVDAKNLIEVGEVDLAKAKLNKAFLYIDGNPKPKDLIIGISSGELANRISLLTKSLQIDVSGVSINKLSLTLAVGETAQLEAFIEPTNATDIMVTWSTSNKKVAIVNQDGTVKALRPGKATIFVRTHDGGYIAECIIMVQN